MRFFESLLVLASLLLLGLQVWRRREDRPHWLAPIALAATPLMLAHLVVDGYRVLLIPSYAVVVFFLFRTIMTLLGEMKPSSAGTGPVRFARGAAAVLTMLLILLSAGVSVVLTPLSNDQDEIIAFLLPARPTDLSGLSWVTAFDSLDRTMRSAYPFSDWKAIPWDTLRKDAWAPIAAAQALGDQQAYLLALRAWVWSIPDAQVALDGDWRALRQELIGGSYGLEAAGLDDGRIIANRVDPLGPAARAGVLVGATLLARNRLPIDSSLTTAQPLWTDAPPATTEARQRGRERSFGRGPVGAVMDLTFQNPDEPFTTVASLIATSEPGVLETPPVAQDSLPVEFAVQDDGIGYLRIRHLGPARGQLLPARAVRRAIGEFASRGVSGVILDVRGNGGGAHKLVTSFMGHLMPGRAFYAQAAVFRPHVDSFEVRPRSALRIHPRGPRYEGRVVVLVDAACINACEGLAAAVRRLPLGMVVGMEGTAGGFGLVGGAIKLPGEVTIRYPATRLLDSLGVIEIESNASGAGGVVPSARVPRNDSTLRALAEGRDVTLEHALSLLLRTPAADSSATVPQP